MSVVSTLTGVAAFTVSKKVGEAIESSLLGRIPSVNGRESIYPHFLMDRAVNRLRGPFLTVSFNTPDQLLGGIGRNGQKIFHRNTFFLKTAVKKTKYLQKIHIMLGNGAMPVPRPENLILCPTTFRFLEVK